jgi:hypothetical protein
MPLSWNEIKDRALRFSREWQHESSEDAEAKSFWDGFFDVFGVSRRRVANFERKIRKLDGKDGYIDLLWKGVLLIEHKSRGKDLDRAHTQARDYFHGLTDAELPRYLLVCDFERFRLYDLETGEIPTEFALKDLQKHVRQFGFIAGYQARSFKEEDPVNVLAAERMGKLHDALKAAGYDGHALEVLLVRLLFCLFADDTGIFRGMPSTSGGAHRVDGADIGHGWRNCSRAQHRAGAPAENPRRATRRIPLRQRQAVRGTVAAGRFRRQHARAVAASQHARLEPHQPGHLRFDVPVGDGCQGPP